MLDAEMLKLNPLQAIAQKYMRDADSHRRAIGDAVADLERILVAGDGDLAPIIARLKGELK